MRIGILGTRGIPNYHGGFEQFAEFFAVYAQQENHEIFVYNSHNHPYQEKKYKNVTIIHCYDPESKIGTAGQFIYDLICIKDARKRNFDIVLQLGYTSNSIWGKFLPNKSTIITNMDGLEWKRSKYSKKVQKFLMYAEKWAIKTSDYLISDSIGIQIYLKEKYQVKSKFIAYGANIFLPTSKKLITDFDLLTEQYYVLIARMEPENNIELILDGFIKSKSSRKFCVVGNMEATVFGRYLKDKYSNYSNIRFLGAIYDLDFLNHLRCYSLLYFHGHSVGGTNPSLLEAMGSRALIAAHNNVFNKAILEEDAFYFKTVNEISNLILTVKKDQNFNKIENNIEKIKVQYNWPIINKQYLDYLIQCHNDQDK
ncbi:DUF1972 domain-containing protein [Xanthomarina sp. F2636L]|uniref:DUF1972 domain-containing protein n=1 Tax=Xanthomarina sp. F2636L TaxID=2996018 RepID=UPI00225E53B0|nr:DUF1972 domain-containing protein [Xanthomarina sp. F2636L]MCX7551332.1 DUF1972 domain-containing protein [Xanthomarina sp. F2636L]